MYNYACGFCIIGQLLVVYAPYLQTIFKTEALGLGDVVFLLLLSSSVLWVDEGRKYWEAVNGRLIFDGYSGLKHVASPVDEDHASLLSREIV